MSAEVGLGVSMTAAKSASYLTPPDAVESRFILGEKDNMAFVDERYGKEARAQVLLKDDPTYLERKFAYNELLQNDQILSHFHGKKDLGICVIEANWSTRLTGFQLRSAIQAGVLDEDGSFMSPYPGDLSNVWWKNYAQYLVSLSCRPIEAEVKVQKIPSELLQQALASVEVNPIYDLSTFKVKEEAVLNKGNVCWFAARRLPSQGDWKLVNISPEDGKYGCGVMLAAVSGKYFEAMKIHMESAVLDSFDNISKFETFNGAASSFPLEKLNIVNSLDYQVASQGMSSKLILTFASNIADRLQMIAENCPMYEGLSEESVQEFFKGDALTEKRCPWLGHGSTANFRLLHLIIMELIKSHKITKLYDAGTHLSLQDKVQIDGFLMEMTQSSMPTLEVSSAIRKGTCLALRRFGYMGVASEDTEGAKQSHKITSQATFLFNTQDFEEALAKLGLPLKMVSVAKMRNYFDKGLTTGSFARDLTKHASYCGKFNRDAAAVHRTTRSVPVKVSFANY